MTANILKVKNLSKTFGAFKAVDKVSFDLREGEILGLLGPNGAGKTTTIQMLLGVLTPTSGSIICFGKKLAENREEILDKINFSSTYTNLPWNLTVRENLTFISYLYDIENRRERLKEMVQIFRLEKVWNKMIMDLSAGQITRVNLAKAFLNHPRIILLDEPTASLDVEVADYIRKFLLEQREKFKMSIIITSHNMAEVEEVCDRVLFINEGKIIADDTPRNLARSIKIARVDLLMDDGIAKIKAYCSEKNLEIDFRGKYARIEVAEENIAGMLRDLNEGKIKFSEISIEKPKLEDYFFQVINAKLKLPK